MKIIHECANLSTLFIAPMDVAGYNQIEPPPIVNNWYKFCPVLDLCFHFKSPAEIEPYLSFEGNASVISCIRFDSVFLNMVKCAEIVINISIILCFGCISCRIVVCLLFEFSFCLVWCCFMTVFKMDLIDMHLAISFPMYCFFVALYWVSQYF